LIDRQNGNIRREQNFVRTLTEIDHRLELTIGRTFL
jgi:hypothetical protein